MNLACLTLLLPVLLSGSEVQWPPAPAEAVVTLAKVIDLRDASPESGFWKRVGRWVGGAGEGDALAAPFDIQLADDHIWMTCNDVRGLVRLDRNSLQFKVFTCDDLPVAQAVAIARLGDAILMTDSGRGVVYRQEGESLDVWLDAGLDRPTGIAVSEAGDRIWVADTGVHQIVVFNAEGQELSRIGTRNEADLGLNFPTFLASDGAAGVIVNDTLNYRIKGFTSSGELSFAFGEEGRAPGQFVRAKGVAQMADGRLVVVDGMLDRVQLFGERGVPIIQIGAQGDAEGMFWSPAGVDVEGDLIYVADTYNHRIQVVRVEEQDGAQ